MEMQFSITVSNTFWGENAEITFFFGVSNRLNKNNSHWGKDLLSEYFLIYSLFRSVTGEMQFAELMQKSSS